MKTSIRVMLVGIGALALLSTVHWAREQQFEGPPLLLHLLGVLPSFAAAIAIPFVVLGMWLESSPVSSSMALRKRFIGITLAAGAGLILWEFGQQSSRALFFDPDDLVATLVGLVVGWGLFAVVSSKPP
ncbi:MAG: hypothetical protein ACK5VQ_12225 [Gammaproteobacteria bacterium]|jgi:phosphate/sulfate permease